MEWLLIITILSASPADTEFVAIPIFDEAACSEAQDLITSIAEATDDPAMVVVQCLPLPGR